MKRIISHLLLITLIVPFTFSGCKKTIPPPLTPIPVVTAISPASAVAGTAITITGTNFDATAANDAVKFNGSAATVVSATTSTLMVNAPIGGSTGPVTVTTAGGTATGPVFTYLQAPTIWS